MLTSASCAVIQSGLPLFIPTVSNPRPAFSKLLFNFHTAGIIFLRYHEDRMTPLLKELEWNLYLSLSFLFAIYGAPRTVSGVQKALGGHRLNGSEIQDDVPPAVTWPRRFSPVHFRPSIPFAFPICRHLSTPAQHPLCPARLHAFACAGPAARHPSPHSPEGLQLAV